MVSEELKLLLSIVNMKILTWNTNGLRARLKDGTLKKVLDLDADVLCFQEIKLSDELIFLEKCFERYHVYHTLARKKGYSGVCILTKKKAKNVYTNSGFERADEEGRYLRIDLDSEHSFLSLYMPHGKRDCSDLSYKLAFADYLLDMLNNKIQNSCIICTDFNIAHEEIDLSRPSANRRNIMFTQEERRVVDKLLNNGYIDVFRYLYPNDSSYTWWPYSFDAYQRNMGWRIDYVFIPSIFLENVRDIILLKGIRGSDHCPLILDMD
ncbi:Exodeoxyribonuclease [Clostridium sp. C105KSO15]|nr:Exodeoxyribonuclease [Clostridium sp. C105KSO15]